MCVCLCVCARTCRLAGGDPALPDLVKRRDELASWLQRAEHAVGSLPLLATGEDLRELKVEENTAEVISTQMFVFLFRSCLHVCVRWQFSLFFLFFLLRCYV